MRILRPTLPVAAVISWDFLVKICFLKVIKVMQRVMRVMGKIRMTSTIIPAPMMLTVVRRTIWNICNMS